MRTRSAWLRIARTTAMAAVLLAAAACGGDGPTSSAVRVPLFVPSGSGANLSMQRGSLAPLGRFHVAIEVREVQDFFGAAFHVSFDPGVAVFEGADDTGSFLREGVADGETLFAYEAARGDVAVVATRRQNPTGTLPGVTIGATPRPLLVLTFRARTVSAGTPFEFASPREVIDSSPPPGQTLDVTWAGGTLRVF